MRNDIFQCNFLSGWCLWGWHRGSCASVSPQPLIRFGHTNPLACPPAWHPTLSLHPSMLSPSPPLSLPNNSTASVDTLLISSTGGSLVNPGFNRSSIEISVSMICIFYLAKIWYWMPFLGICNPSHVPHLSWLDTVIRSTLAYGWQASSLHQIHNNFIMDWLNMLQMIAFYDYK